MAGKISTILLLIDIPLMAVKSCCSIFQLRETQVEFYQQTFMPFIAEWQKYEGFI